MRRREKSIKNVLIMPNEPNFRKSQIFITVISTRSYNEKMKLDTWSKRTQTKPILSRAQSRDLSKQLLPHPLNPRIMSLRFYPPQAG